MIHGQCVERVVCVTGCVCCVVLLAFVTCVRIGTEIRSTFVRYDTIGQKNAASCGRIIVLAIDECKKFVDESSVDRSRGCCVATVQNLLSLYIAVCVCAVNHTTGVIRSTTYGGGDTAVFALKK
ncbi:unnamed protein product [Pylaiella littoralis]